MAKRCPSCNLVNPDRAVRCDCGRSFVDGSMAARLVLAATRPKLDRFSRRSLWLFWGAVAVLLGCLIALKLGANGVAVGAIAIGAVLVKGGVLIAVKIRSG